MSEFISFLLHPRDSECWAFLSVPSQTGQVSFKPCLHHGRAPEARYSHVVAVVRQDSMKYPQDSNVSSTGPGT